MLLLAAKTTLIRAKATGTLGIIITNEGVVDREVEGVGIEVVEAEDVAMGAKTSHVRTTRTQRSRRTILRTSCQLISVPFAARRATIKLIVMCIRGSKPNI